MQHATVPPPPLREYIPALSVEVEEVILTALAKDPKDRFATIDAFAQALTQAAEPTRAPRHSRPSTPQPPELLPAPLPRFVPTTNEQPPETTLPMQESFVTRPPLRAKKRSRQWLLLACALLALASILWNINTSNTQHIQATAVAQGLTAQAHIATISVTPQSSTTATPVPEPPSSVMLRLSASGISPTSQG